MNLEGYKIEVALINDKLFSILIYKDKKEPLYYIWETHVYLAEELYKIFYKEAQIMYGGEYFYSADSKYTSEEQRELLLKELIHIKKAFIPKLAEVYEQILNNFLFDV